jgi:uncharacterized membrane protein YeaQ/YmgE (transglycosylase-associated protein family)
MDVSIGPGIVSWIFLGLIAGWLASRFMAGGHGLVGDIILGIAGAIAGGYVGGLILGRDLIVTGINLDSILVAFLGAILLIAVSRMFTRRRRFGVF